MHPWCVGGVVALASAMGGAAQAASVSSGQTLDLDGDGTAELTFVRGFAPHPETLPGTPDTYYSTGFIPAPHVEFFVRYIILDNFDTDEEGVPFLQSAFLERGDTIDADRAWRSVADFEPYGPFRNHPDGSVNIGHAWEDAARDSTAWTLGADPGAIPLRWTQGDDTFYGWVGVRSVPREGDDGSFQLTLDLIDHAYNPDPGEGIDAWEQPGHAGVVPTPAAAPLGLAVMALAMLRRRA